MPDKIAGFNEVTDRLKLVLELSSDAELAARLGFSARAWSQRKTRQSLPVEEIDALIEREQLSARFVYEGQGSVHVPFDDIEWRDAFDARLKRTLQDPALLLRLPIEVRQSDLPKLMSRKGEPALTLFRDLRRSGVDLHALFCDEPEPTAKAQQVLAAYMRGDEDGKALVEQTASYVERKAIFAPSSTPRMKVRITGNVGQQGQGIVNHAPVSITQTGAPPKKARPPK